MSVSEHKNRNFEIAQHAHTLATNLDIGFHDAYRIAQCTAKKPYDTESEAKEAAEGWGQYTYRCPLCGKWHCTKTPPKYLV